MTFLITLILLAGFGSMMYIRSSGGVFQPAMLFIAGMLYIFVLQGAWLAPYGASRYGGNAVEAALYAALITMFTFTAGFAAAGRFRVSRQLPRLGRNWDRGRLLRIAGALLVIGTLLNVFSIFAAGGLSAWDANAGDRRAVNVESGYIAQLDALVPVAIAILLCFARKQSAVVVAVLVAVLWLLFYFYAGSRGRFIALGFVLVGGLAFRRNWEPRLLTFFTLFLAAATIGTFLGTNRATFSGFQVSQDLGSFTGALAEAVPFRQDSVTASNQLVAGMELPLTVGIFATVPTVIPHAPSALEEFLTRPIPRAWQAEGKRYPYYEAVTPLFGITGASNHWVTYGRSPIRAGPALGFVGHWYFIGGYIALLLAAFGTGVLYRRLSAWCSTPERNPGGAAITLFVAQIGFVDALATPMFWVFSATPMLIGILAILFCRIPTSRNRLFSPGPPTLTKPRFQS